MFSFIITWQPECQLGRPLISWVNTCRGTNAVLPWPVLFLLQLWWPVLWVDWWTADGIIISVDTRLWVDNFREKVLDQATCKALCGFHFMDDIFEIRKARRVLVTHEWCSPEHYVHHGNGERWSPSIPWHSAFVREPVACWDTRFTGNTLTPFKISQGECLH
jgi:hypothetical protein